MHGMQWGRTLKSISHFNKMVKILDDNFPERLHVALVVRAPWIFTSIYKLVSPILDAPTREKVQIYGSGPKYLKAIAKYVDLSQVPNWLGGTSMTCNIPYGGTIKKGQIKTGWQNPDEGGENESDGDWTTAEIAAGASETASFELAPNAKVEWEFNVESHDIDFSVLGAEEKEVVEKARYASGDTHAGSFANQSSKTITVNLVWDNSYSWATSKCVKYQVKGSAGEEADAAAKGIANMNVAAEEDYSTDEDL